MVKEYFMRASQRKKEQEYRYSQEVLRDAIEIEDRYEQVLNETLGRAKTEEMLKAQDGRQYTKF